MAKWLEKYQDGGEYLGTTTKGFNYNGAWGGPSMQRGGNIQPPMAGARTQGIPSEGPYGKKTVPSAQKGKKQEPSSIDLAKIKSRMALESHFGNPSARRMTTPYPQDLLFKLNAGPDKGKMGRGTHWMGTIDNYVVPNIQEGSDGKLFFNQNASPLDREAMRFETPEEALMFAENYKEVAPMMRNNFQNGGEMQFYQNGLDWTPRNISEYGSEIPMAQGGKELPFWMKKQSDISQRGNQQLKTEIPARLSKERKAEEKVQKLVQYKNYDEKAARRAVQNKTKAGERDLKEIQRVETRAAAHPDYKPRSSYQQMQALSEAGDLRSRILRGANLLTNQGTPLDFITSAVTSPVTAGTNLLLNPQKYINPEEGIAGNIANLGFDLMDIIPGGAVVGTVGKTARQVGKQAAKELTQTGTANLSKKLAKTKDQLSAAFKGTDSVLEQFTGELLRGRANRRSIKEGNTWLENWIKHPSTQAKIDKDVDNALNFSQFLKDPQSNIKELELIRDQSKNFTPVSKEYSLFKQADDNLQQYFGRNITPIHNDNWGVSYMHGYSPMTREAIDKGIVNPNDRYGSWISRTPFLRQDKRIGTTIHEGTHDWVSSEAFQKSGMRNEVLNVMNPEIKNDFLTWEKARFNRTDPSDILGKERAYQAYLADPTEMHARVMELRKHLGLSPDDVLDEDYGRKTIDYLTALPLKKQPIDVQGFLNVIDDDPKKLSHLLNRLWAASPYAVPTAVGLGAVASGAGSEEVPQQKKGGVVKDNNGYWNPDNWGKVVEIDSPNITMKGVNQDLIGVSDEGDVKYMKPGKDYKFKGKKVKEYPVGKYGVNQQDEKTVQHLDQLLNFTNKPKAKNGWLDKYN